jgi:hypothetical protein
MVELDDVVPAITVEVAHSALHAVRFAELDGPWV